MARRIVLTSFAVLLLAAVVDFAGFKGRVWGPTPVLFATLMGLTSLAALGVAAFLVRDVVRGRRRVAAAGALAAILGLVATTAGGLGSWLTSLRGFVVLLEGEKLSLAGGDNLRDLQRGRFASRADLDTTLGLLSLDFQQTSDGFYPEAKVLAIRSGDQRENLTVLQDVPAKAGSLVVYLGAFGFAPRVVVLKGEETLLDETVLFTTRREGEKGVSFEGDVDVGRDGLHVIGAVNLKSEAAAVRGHPSLSIALRQGEEELGGGEMQLGHFAEAKGGYRVGIAGMKKWAELDVARSGGPRTARLGLALCVLGLGAWGVGAWRKW